MHSAATVAGRSVLDLCTGSGVVALAASRLGAGRVSAYDVCRRAVECARSNAEQAGRRVDVCHGTWAEAVRHGPYDVVVSNPPYVPAGPDSHLETIPDHLGPSRAWDAGPDGRMVLDPLCNAAPALLRHGGAMLIVQSEFADPGKSVAMLRGHRLATEVVLTETIPFGPVLTARAAWMERTGLLQPGRREENLLVIRAEKR